MNAVGIDVSKGKSTVAVMQPLGVVAASPFEVNHTEDELRELAKFLKSFRVRQKSLWSTREIIMNRLLVISAVKGYLFA